ncbi:MAG: NHLP leader peptide family natural product precursor, partial [Nostoc sp. DedQUE12a]|nr:NHLP leader peptide family natural product precursor [Nostoc sp. DedQUE12a]
MSEQEQAQTRQDIEARIIARAWKDEAYKQELLTNP